MASSAASTSTSTLPLSQNEPKKPFISPLVRSYFIAGGCAGAASRTVVSPLERLKIIQQVQPQSSDGRAYRGVWASLVRMWREEGFKGFMRGNGINCVRIVPYSAVQFTTYEQLKKFFTANGTRELDTPTRLLSGALAGITSVCTTYPLDLVRARLSIASATLAVRPLSQSTPPSVKPTAATPASSMSMSTVAAGAASRVAPAPLQEKVPGMWGMTLKVMHEEGGVRALYRGLVPTAVGVAPYVAINFTAYESLRILITPPGQDHPAWKKLACGGLAGSISQTLTYPFDVLRRKMQVAGMSAGALGYKYNGAFDALRQIIRHEGFIGLYRGLWPNLLKVAPSIATSFFVYETVKEFLVEP